MKTYSLFDNLYIIKQKKGVFIIYLPLKHIAFSADEDLILALNYFKTHPNEKIKDNVYIEKITEFLSEFNLDIQSISNDQMPPKPRINLNPTLVTLLPTFDCNLRCVYCYANSGKVLKKRMSFEVAKAAIDLISDNASNSNEKLFGLSFHGGGEPTMAWKLITKSVSYAKEIAKNRKLKLQTHITTNGVLNSHQREWIAENISRIQVSFDGPEIIQNKQRPMANGEGSFDKVLETIKFFTNRGANFGIQTVISNDSVDLMEEITSFFSKIAPNCNIHFEPIFECGRCIYTGWETPDPDIYVKNYLKAWKKAASKGISLVSSLSRLDVCTSTYCGASGNNFFITPNGYVTSCLEVTNLKDIRSDLFIYGKFDQKLKKFYIDFEKLSTLAARNIHNIPACRDCAIKWHCAGNCPSKSMLNGDLYNPTTSERCHISQSISINQLFNLINHPESGKSSNIEVIDLMSKMNKNNSVTN
ncbi:MAG: radical SAM protein [Pelolinea sp.]|nr:radical SAM protein [Pelolinea sp.]